MLILQVVVEILGRDVARVDNRVVDRVHIPKGGIDVKQVLKRPLPWNQDGGFVVDEAVDMGHHAPRSINWIPTRWKMLIILPMLYLRHLPQRPPLHFSPGQ